MIDVINRFRRQNNVDPVGHIDSQVNQYCLMHCLEMSRQNSVCHAPDYYLNEWSEAVAMIQYCEDWQDRVIFDILGSSDVGHRDLLLQSNTISYASCIHDWVVYVTIRGTNN